MNQPAKTNPVVLTKQQRQRGQALVIAKDVLLGTPFVFGGQSNERSASELIKIADYVLDGSDAIGPVLDIPTPPDMHAGLKLVAVDVNWEPGPGGDLRHVHTRYEQEPESNHTHIVATVPTGADHIAAVINSRSIPEGGAA